MKKENLIVAMVVSAFILVSGNASAANLNGNWLGAQYCSDDGGASPELIDITITQTGDFFAAYNNNSLQTCGGAIDGTKVSISCPDYTIAYGEVKGKKMYVINHIPLPNEGKTCKGTLTKQAG